MIQEQYQVNLVHCEAQFVMRVACIISQTLLELDDHIPPIIEQLYLNYKLLVI